MAKTKAVHCLFTHNSEGDQLQWFAKILQLKIVSTTAHLLHCCESTTNFTELIINSHLIKSNQSKHSRNIVVKTINKSDVYLHVLLKAIITR